ncbi:hypothetical protein [Armatimonas sp.]|uniref:hypothetical protein n=1 Tax=Armatimonas sp. TaxID=1872638 RepID=UPI00286A0EE6|nr:hypothetical protein [Armatimonas sp.]
MQQLLFVVGTFVFFGVLGTLVGIWERRIVWPYSEPLSLDLMQDEYRTAANQGFVDATLQGMQQDGFSLLCRFQDARRAKYKLSYIFFISPDRATLAMLGYGNMVGIQIKGITLISKNSDGHYYYTTNSSGAERYDVSGSSDTQVATSVRDFSTLYAKHQKWLLRKTTPSAFPSDGALQEYRKFLTNRCDLRQSHGLIRYSDSEKNEWRYTLLGSLKFSFIGTFRGIFGL